MKRLILLVSPLLILALVIAGCASAEQSVPEEAPGAIVTTEEPAEAPEAGDLVTEEPAAGVVETPAAEEVEAEAMTTDEPAEAPEAGALATEEPEASMAETPAPSDEVAESAQVGEPETDEAEVIPPTGAANFGRMSNLLDFDVWNNDEQIGSVNAIVINQDTSQIEYVVVGIGGFLGLGESELPVPWQVIQLTDATAVEAESNVEGDESELETPQNAFVLDISQEELEQLPAFDLTSLYEQPQVTGEESEAPEGMSFEELEQEIHNFWQSEPAAEMSDRTNLVLAEDLLGATVRDDAAVMSEQSSDTTQEDTTQVEPIQDLGVVEEIMVDLNTGKVTYLLISLNAAPEVGLQEAPAAGIEATPAEGVQEAPAAEVVEDPLTIQAVAVPLDALEWHAEEGVLIYSGSQLLEEAPTIDLEQFELDQSFSWMSEADSFWGVEESPESEGTE